MKRMATTASNSKLSQILDIVKELSREGLCAVIDEARKILSNECAFIIQSIPNDIWQIIFTLTINSLYKYNNEELEVEYQLFILSRVCRSWKDLVGDFVRYYFAFDTTQSNWIMSHFDNHTSMKLESSAYIRDELAPVIYHRKDYSQNGLQRFTNLQQLTLTRDSYRVLPLSQLSNLTELNIDSSSSFLGLHAPERCFSLPPFLTTLKLGSVKAFFFDTDLYACVHLKYLDLEGNQTISDVGVKDLTNLTFLHAGSKLSSQSLLRLSNLTHLIIDRECSDLRHDGVSLLTNLRILECYSSYGITDKGLKCLSNLTKLKFRMIEVIDQGLPTLTNLTSLSLIDIPSGEWYLTKKALIPLVKLRKLRLIDVEADDEDIPQLAHLPIESLALYYEHSISYEGLLQFTNLKKLDISVDRSLTNRDLKCLTNLTKLNISSHTKITDSGIRKLTNITWLNISPLITSEGISRLTDLRTLKFAAKTSQRILDREYIPVDYGDDKEDEFVFECGDDALRCLTNLTCLDISRAFDVSFKRGLIYLPNLNTLYCRRISLFSFTKKKITFPSLSSLFSG